MLSNSRCYRTGYVVATISLSELRFATLNLGWEGLLKCSRKPNQMTYNAHRNAQLNLSAKKKGKLDVVTTWCTYVAAGKECQLTFSPCRALKRTQS